MLYKYFNDFDDLLAKPAKKGGSKTAEKGGAGKSAKTKVDVSRVFSPNKKVLMEKLDRIIPSSLRIDSLKPIDSSGFSPEGADMIAYREYCRDIAVIMNGFIPCELIYGTYHIVPMLDKKTLIETINKIVTVKKIDRFSMAPNDEPVLPIPAFVIAYRTNYSFPDLKNDVINYYMNKNIDPTTELDILVVVNKGIVVKNWRERRSYIAFETGKDSMLSFFILMNEYLEIERTKEVDFRKYSKKDVKYNEF